VVGQLRKLEAVSRATTLRNQRYLVPKNLQGSRCALTLVAELRGLDMAHNAKKTEHSGAKRSRGGYAGQKRAAKHESNKLRRLTDRRAVREENRTSA